MRNAGLLLLLCACTTSRQLALPLGAADLRELNDAMEGREVDLSWARETDYVHADAREVHLAPDAVRFTLDGQPREVPALALHSVSYLSPGSPRTRGALEGLLFGGPIALAGAAVGISAAATCAPGASCRTETLAPLLVGALVGLVIAPITGALIGHHDEAAFTLSR